MLKKLLINRWKEVLLVLLILAAMAGTSSAAIYNLRADVTIKTIDGAVIPMWGFALVSYDVGAGTVAGDDIVKVPGPELAVPPGQGLTINLTNNLPVPVSIVIPGQAATMTPVWVDVNGIVVPSPSPGYRPADVTSRVRSLTHEAAANGGIASYTWANIKPGTYLYQSGTDPAVQVQMGLYGAVKKDFAAGQAYNNPNALYNNEVILLFSAIDPDIHHSAATGNYTGIPLQNIPGYAPPPPPYVIKIFTSTIDYWPRYFLINGEPYSAATLPLSAGNINEKTLIRFLNAGLQTYVPTLMGSHISMVAEDGNLSPFPKEQYSLILPAGKTIDAIFAPQLNGSYPIFDRRLNVTSAGTYPGGMIAKLSVGGTVTAPTAVNDTYSVAAGGTLIVAAPGVLGNDSGTGPLTAALVIGSGPANGTLTLNANGSFTYTPNAGFSGIDSFQYTANNGGGASAAATVTINVVSNTAPVANDQAVTTNEDTAVPIILTANDAEGDPLTYNVIAPPGNGTLTGTPPNVTYTPASNYFGPDSFTFKANDGLVDSNVATVSITINPVNDPPMAVDDNASTTQNTPVTINVVANDFDVDGTVNPATVIVTNPTRGGTVVNHLNGTVTFTPKRNFRGTDTFTYTVRDNIGALSNTATVRVNVVR